MANRPTVALVFSYGAPSDVVHYVRSFEELGVDRLVLIAEGDLDVRQVEREIRDRPIELVYQAERRGKARAFNAGVARVRPDEIVFAISGDVRIPPGLLPKLACRLTDEVGLVLPRIRQTATGGFWSRVSRAMWEVRDTFLAEKADRGEFMVGGEVQAFRPEVAVPVSESINEDAFSCDVARCLGYRIGYARDLVATNFAPVSLRDLWVQRLRVNLGHVEFGVIPERATISLGSTLLRRPARAVATLGRFLREHPGEAGYLPFAALLEVGSVVAAHARRAAAREMRVWPMAATAPRPVAERSKVDAAAERPPVRAGLLKVGESRLAQER